MRTGRKQRVAAIVVGVTVILLSLVALRCSPLAPGPGLPAGATRLQISTAPAHLLPAFGCPLALLGPVRVAVAGDVVQFVTLDTGEPVDAVWPSGWAAWTIDGRAELVARDGSLIAREGDVIENRFGGGVGVDNRFHVCIEGQ
jgi:hypothetical protein